MRAEEKNRIQECDNIGEDFPEIQKLKCDNFTFTVYLRVAENVKICVKLSYDNIIKTIPDD